jgi:hypothetical protein
MHRNDPGGPLAALIAAVAFFWGARIYGTLVVGAAPGEPVPLSVFQIGLMALGILLVIYGIIGLVTIWLEGRELQLGRRRARPGRVAFTVGLVLVAILVAASGLFAGIIGEDLHAVRAHPAREGLLAGIIFLLAALVLAFYRRFFMDDVVEADDERSEVPW